MSPFLEVKGAAKSFGGVKALDDVSMSVDIGESVALMGGNGAGKSTLVSLLAGLRTPDSGEIWIEGQKREIGNPLQARGFGIETVFQDLALCPNLDAPGNLFLGRELAYRIGPIRFLDRKAMERDAKRLLADLGVTIPDLRATTRSYSGGQRQILAFARAASANSRLLILDEPTAALGVEERANVIATVQKLRRERGMAVLLITHNLEEMRALADRAVVLRRGCNVGNVDLSKANDDEVVGRITGSIAA